MLEELQRITNAERLADAQQFHLGQIAREARPSGRPLRVVMADARRAVASYLDRDGVTAKQSQRRLARVF